MKLHKLIADLSAIEDWSRWDVFITPSINGDGYQIGVIYDDDECGEMRIVATFPNGGDLCDVMKSTVGIVRTPLCAQCGGTGTSYTVDYPVCPRCGGTGDEPSSNKQE